MDTILNLLAGMNKFAGIFQDWVNAHLQLVTVVLIPFLAWFVTKSFEKASLNRLASAQLIERSLQREMKLVDIRYNRLEAFRQDVGKLAALSLVGERNADQVIEFNDAYSRLGVLVGSFPASAERGRLTKCLQGIGNVDVVRSGGTGFLVIASQSILEIEWASMRDALENTEHSKTQTSTTSGGS
ncbi:hypothetical protein [Tropicibacter sp. Alg240-R139]|uniref:hypothetical protein n=1 Tax=Tropicibacter sp. Alg240-R139 TaxID=2305991 RepID=UPI0013E0979C|nr:hypothetical protein [Tropicibacter sp. Alg240-R139]